MAGKQVLPTMGGGSKVMPKLIGILVLLAVLTLIVKHPTEAAGWVDTLFQLGATVVDGLANFFQAVAQ
jgi:hypothetical protein